MTWTQIIITIFTSVLASSGLWAFLGSRLDRRVERRSAEKEILLGIAHIELVFFGMQYIDRGWISKDEYDTLQDLYKPYKKLGGNGSGTKIMNEVEKLPLKEG
jgi:hypothetical protein